MLQLVDIFIARQPILNHKQQLIGYELLFRSGEQNNAAAILQPEEATSNVITNSFSEFGIEQIVGEGNKAFINYTENLLLLLDEPFFSPKNVVIEVLEHVKVTKNLINQLQTLKKKGYKIALDDYIFSKEMKPLEELADIIKVDILQVDVNKFSDEISRIKENNIKLLAEKVETPEQFETCRKLGFDYYQGYFFSKPVIIKGKKLPASQITVIQILSKISDPNIPLKTLIDLVKQDVSLSQKLINAMSTLYPKHEVKSVNDAVIKFGIGRLQNWITMISLSGLDNKPKELYKTALVRARFCELIGQELGDYAPETYFTVGLFSILDVAFSLPMNEILSKMCLEKDLKLALTDGHGVLGEILDTIKKIEKGQIHVPQKANLTISTMTKKYILAIDYANRLTMN
ncbi:MAG: EAL domain-containing protein [Thiomicrospira sp.]